MDAYTLDTILLWTPLLLVALTFIFLKKNPNVKLKSPVDNEEFIYIPLKTFSQRLTKIISSEMITSYNEGILFLQQDKMLEETIKFYEDSCVPLPENYSPEFKESFEKSLDGRFWHNDIVDAYLLLQCCYTESKVELPKETILKFNNILDNILNDKKINEVSKYKVPFHKYFFYTMLHMYNTNALEMYERAMDLYIKTDGLKDDIARYCNCEEDLENTQILLLQLEKYGNFQSISEEIYRTIFGKYVNSIQNYAPFDINNKLD